MSAFNTWRRMTASWAVLGVLGVHSGISAAEHHDRPLATEQTMIRDWLTRVNPSVVAVRFEDRYDSSGVIVSENGLVLTHGHHVSPVLHEDRQIVTNHEVSVLLSDGRQTSARLLATHSSDGFDYSSRARSTGLGGLALATSHETWYNPLVQLRFPAMAIAEER